MERPDPNAEHHETAAEREPQPHDVALACREVLRQLVPNADPQDIEENLATITEAPDREFAFANAGTCFAFFDVDMDEALTRLGEILQLQAILPASDAAMRGRRGAKQE